MRDPVVSVIVPTFNSSRTLRPAIASVVGQSLEDIEVWVVGDGCSDDSGDVVASFADERLRWLNLERNSGGPSVPRSEGWRRAHGRYIAYLGHDDLWLPWHLSGLVEAIQRAGASFACSVAARIAPTGPVNVFSFPDDRWGMGHGLSPSNWLHEAALGDTIGRWRPELTVADDAEFCLRILASGTERTLSPRLSVLKYPSGWWRLYDPAAELPQEAHLERIRSDPDGYEREILTSMALAISQRPVSRPRTITGGLIRRTVRWLCDAYGRSRWPLDRLLYARYRRRAGLPPRAFPGRGNGQTGRENHQPDEAKANP